MAMTKTSLFITLFAVATLMATAGVPQGRRGGPPGAAAGPRQGSIERVIVHGKALEGNLEGDMPDRNVTVYLPPSYAADPMRKFPVVYFLPGYAEHSDGPIERLKEFADKLAAVQGFSEPIVVAPDAYTLHKGSMYSSSATVGD